MGGAAFRVMRWRMFFALPWFVLCCEVRHGVRVMKVMKVVKVEKVRGSRSSGRVRLLPAVMS